MEPEKRSENEVDPHVAELIESFYKEFLKQGNQREMRKKVVHPLLKHLLFLFGPIFSAIIGLFTFLIFLILVILIILIVWVIVPSAQVCTNPVS